MQADEGNDYPPQGNNYPQIHPDLQSHPPHSNPEGGLPNEQPPLSSPHPHPHHALPQPYQQYDPRVAQLPTGYALQYANEPTNGHGSGHGNLQQRVQQAGGSPATPQKGNRLRKACDSCSSRKVKCDENRPCGPCVALELECKTERPSKRRGPPNKHAEAQKRAKLEAEAGYAASPNSPSFAANALASLHQGYPPQAIRAPVQPDYVTAESICELPILELLVDDFFTYIHPLCPFPHEPTFREAFKNREDLRNPSFLALLASMMAMLVASFPRKPRIHLKALGRGHHFPSSKSFIDNCHAVAARARGEGYVEKKLNVHSPATSYFLGLSRCYTFQWDHARLYWAETMTMTRILGAHKASYAQNLEEGVNYIEQEIGRRVFWVMLVTIRSMEQYGAKYGELFFPPPTPNDPYPPFPVEVDDEYIFVHEIKPQPVGTISQLAGYNLNLRIYSTVTPLTKLEMAWDFFDWNRQKKVIEGCLLDVKKVLDTAPRELLLQPDPTHHFPPPISQQSYPSMTNSLNGEGQWFTPQNPEARRRQQFEIQKANIYASQLGTRSYLVEKYWSLLEYQRLNPGPDASTKSSDNDEIEANVAKERESIVEELLLLLRTISQENMEPNGTSFHNKIRQIASTLMDDPQDRKGPFALRSEGNLRTFLDFLMELEKTGPRVSSDSGDGLDEEEELRAWADLREYQMRFVQAGGFAV